MASPRYKKTADLYRTGAVVEVEPGLAMWAQALNSFDQDEARRQAHVMRSRVVMALKGPGADELERVRAQFYEHGRDEAVATITEAKVARAYSDLQRKLLDDEEWSEKLEIMARSNDALTLPEGDPERELLGQITREYGEHVTEEMTKETEFQQRRLEALSDEQLIEEYVDLHLEVRGNKVAMEELQVQEVLHGLRVCYAEKDEDGGWPAPSSHPEACGHHDERVFSDREEVKDLPDELFDLLCVAMDEVTMSDHEAKGSGSRADSSGSSRLPSEQGASTDSGQTDESSEPATTSS